MIELFIEDIFERNGFYCGGGWNLKEKICSMFIETGRDIYTALNYSPKLSKWFEEKKINFQLTSTFCDNWYPERKINLSTPA